jgi:hypothetical protein
VFDLWFELLKKESEEISDYFTMIFKKQYYCDHCNSVSQSQTPKEEAIVKWAISGKNIQDLLPSKFPTGLITCPKCKVP